eukprot:COSAG02_NODE_9479_length_2204_cov_4.132870_1_plen_46_part_10
MARKLTMLPGAGRWTPAEDDQLRSLVNKFHGEWKRITAAMPGRTTI